MRRCRHWGHRKVLVSGDDWGHPLSIGVVCKRCKDPATYATIASAEPDPFRADWVRVVGFDRLRGLLEVRQR